MARAKRLQIYSSLARLAFNQYLAYHEGHYGFRQRSYDAKPWLLSVARSVQDYESRFSRQLSQCGDLF